eukprot:103367-Chlamydomonas_euryale.AAC.1
MAAGCRHTLAQNKFVESNFVEDSCVKKGALAAAAARLRVHAALARAMAKCRASAALPPPTHSAFKRRCVGTAPLTHTHTHTQSAAEGRRVCTVPLSRRPCVPQPPGLFFLAQPVRPLSRESRSGCALGKYSRPAAQQQAGRACAWGRLPPSSASRQPAGLWLCSCSCNVAGGAG